MGSMLPYIAAPWILWDMPETYVINWHMLGKLVINNGMSFGAMISDNSMNKMLNDST